MKATGVVRKLDQLGRVVIPKEVRSQLDLQDKDPVEIFIEGDRIILQKYKPQEACVITGEITPQNKVLGNGIVVSPKGMEQLLNVLKKALNNK